MPTDYVAKITKYDHASIAKMLADIRNGVPLRGWDAGKAFEHLILRGFELEGAEVRYPYDVPSGSMVLEQIDGVVYSQGISCLVESKDYKDPVNIEPVAKMRSQLMRRPPATMGVLFARSGFTEPMKQLIRFMSPLQVLLWETEELQEALDKQKIVCGTSHKISPSG